MRLRLLPVFFLLAAAVAAEPPVAKEYEAFCAELEKTLVAGDPALLEKSLDLDAVFDAAQKGVEDANLRKQFRAGVRKSFSFASTVAAHAKEAGSYRRMRLRTEKGQVKALFRMVAEGGLNYHDLHLAKGPSGAVRITDIYVFIAGEKLSDTFRRPFLALAASAQRGLLDRLIGTESEFVKHIDKIGRYMDLHKAGKDAEALAVILSLPPALQKEKTVLLPRMLIAQAVGDKEYEAACAAVMAAYPDDPAMDLSVVDGLLFSKKYAEAQKRLDRLDKAVGGDPYIEFLRGNVYHSAGDAAKAQAAFEKAVESEPGLQGPYWSLVTVAIEAKDHAATARWLGELIDRFGLSLDGVEENEMYAGFVESAEYRAWRAKYPRTAPAAE